MVNLTLLEPQTNRPLQNWQFTEKSRIGIGRALNNDVVLKGYFQVSRKHLEIIQVEEQWQLINYGTNGTLVNESFVEQKILEEGDLIRLAENGPLFRFELSVSLDDDALESTDSPSLNQTQCEHHNNPPNSVFCIHCGLKLNK